MAVWGGSESGRSPFGGGEAGGRRVGCLRAAARTLIPGGRLLVVGHGSVGFGVPDRRVGGEDCRAVRWPSPVRTAGLPVPGSGPVSTVAGRLASTRCRCDRLTSGLLAWPFAKPTRADRLLPRFARSRCPLPPAARRPLASASLFCPLPPARHPARRPSSVSRRLLSPRLAPATPATPGGCCRSRPPPLALPILAPPCPWPATPNKPHSQRPASSLFHHPIPKPPLLPIPPSCPFPDLRRIARQNPPC